MSKELALLEVEQPKLSETIKEQVNNISEYSQKLGYKFYENNPPGIERGRRGSDNNLLSRALVAAKSSTKDAITRKIAAEIYNRNVANKNRGPLDDWTDAEKVVGKVTRSHILTTLKNNNIDVFTIESVDSYKHAMINKEEEKLSKNTPVLSKLFKNKWTQDQRFSWRTVLLSSFSKPVPEYVLETALNIKNIYPDAELYVDELTSTSLPSIYKKQFNEEFNINQTPIIANTSENSGQLDPFLVAVIYGEVYYVDVWDEPDFTAQRKFEN